MAYYAAVISLKRTIHRLLNSSQISSHPPSSEILQIAFKEVSSLQEFIQEFESNGGPSGERANTLRAQIREAVCKLEDELESSQFLSQTENQFGADEGPSLKLSPDLEEVKQEINSFTKMVKKIEEEYTKEDLELNSALSEESDAVSSNIGFDGKNSKMIGLSDQFSKIIDMLAEWWSSKLQVVSLVGMAGIGKTTIAKKIFEDEIILSHFELRAFVTIGPTYNFKQLLLDILSQMDYDVDNMHLKGDQILADCLYRTLIGRRYLIVMDDIWNTHDLDEFKSLLPYDENGSRILLTTRLEGVAQYANLFGVLKIRFLNEEESWDLLREKVFREGYLCPYELEKHGKKIAENCEGLPLKIVTVADFLSKKEKTPEYWKETAEKKNQVFTDADDKILKVLFPSYKYLPQHLKPCFLYMGVFPPSCEIRASKLINLWIAEGFLELNPSYYLEDFAKKCLEELVSRSVVLVRQQSSSHRTKICSLHSVFWHLCFRQASKEKFFHVINSCDDKFVEALENQRRMCIHNNVLLGIEDVRQPMESISTARSLLCTGPHHQYPVPLCYTLRLLRVLDALTIRFYKFPIEVVELVQLKYLALTSTGKFPTSISKLQKLQYLIVGRHLSIKSVGAESYLPMEIWDMQELKHLQFVGSNLPDPCGALLPNLLTLLDVSIHSCTKGVLDKIPNLKKLGIQIELAPDVAEPLSCFDHISCLHKIESLKCVIVNPKPRSQFVASITAFPSCLKKLSLTGFGYPWEYMRMIAKLPHLEALKLRFYAFQGPELETFDGEFSQLKLLLIEDTDLVLWRSGGECFPLLERLIIRHCYKLKEIPLDIGDITTLEKMELVDCPLAMATIKDIQDDQNDKGNNFLKISVHSSWDVKRKS